MRVVAFALVLCVCAACASTPRPAVPAAPPPDPRTQLAALETRIYDLVQFERHRINPNAKGLRLDSELIGVARKHSLDMAQNNYFAHTSPSGETSTSIIMDEDAQFQGLLGENIALVHFAPQSGIDVNGMARQFVDVWLNSPKHRENLSVTVYDRTGVGAALKGDTVYVTELFATDLGLPPAPLGAADERSSDAVSGTQSGNPAPAVAPASAAPVPAVSPGG